MEFDYTIVAWGADFRFENGKWEYYNFVGNRWNKISSPDNKLYLKNAYRVLLTRARQGMAIFVPYGDDNDPTRSTKWYDENYKYLEDIFR